MTTLTYTAHNISCSHCVHTIQTEVSELAGVKLVEAKQDTKRVTIGFDSPATKEQIEARMAEIGYPVTPA
jgi:copper chaperone CopZ